MQEVTLEHLPEFIQCITLDETFKNHDGSLTHVCNAGTAEFPMRYTVLICPDDKVFINPPFFTELYMRILNNMKQPTVFQ